jgi:lipoprotein-releasing system permease protein
MKLEWFIARRYLASRRGARFLSLITVISVGGVSVGVLALILVTAVMTGLQTELRQQLLGSTAHVWVLPSGAQMRMEDHVANLQRVREVPGVVAAAPFVNVEVGLLTQAEYPEAVVLRGIDPATDGPPVTELVGQIRDGALHLDPELAESGLPPLLVGEELASRLGLYTGSVIQLLSIQGVRRTLMDPFARPNRFEVVGHFATGFHQFDDRFAYTTLEAAQELTGLGTAVTGIEVRAPDAAQAAAVGRRIEAALGPDYIAQDWYTMNASLFDALKLERLAMRIILSLIVVVAAFNIIGTLVMVVTDKTREIGILKSMGLRASQVQRVFMLQGLTIGAIGGTVGTLGGLAIVWLQNRYGIIAIPEQVYFLDRLPMEIEAAEVALIFGMSVLISFLATLYPARRAAQLAPVEAIREE